MQEKANHTFINTLLTHTISYAYKTGNTQIIAVHTFHNPSSCINHAKPKKTSPINPKSVVNINDYMDRIECCSQKCGEGCRTQTTTK